ncbi:MAG TPA: flagellar basal body P-ring formation chaperone FlgA [Gemmatimonadales bacterium]|nr:flagellar basal body P-ring formation chaperone FlgA [Gemmatimonadales bacterium]
MLTALASLASLVSPGRSSAQARLAFVGTGDVSPRLSARVAAAISREWRVDTSRIVLSWGSASPAPVSDTAGFRLIGGEGGWFSLLFEQGRGPGAWLRLRAGIAVEQPVATRALTPGTVLGAGDIRIEPRVNWGPLPADSEASAEAGWVVRRPIAGGEVLAGFRVAPPPVVTAGKPVKMYYNTGRVSVAIEGVALNDAAMGQPVRMRTTGRIGVMAGTAVAPGEARME